MNLKVKEVPFYRKKKDLTVEKSHYFVLKKKRMMNSAILPRISDLETDKETSIGSPDTSPVTF